MPAHHVTAWLILPMRATARPEARGRIPGGFMPTAFEVMVGVKSDGAVGAQGGGGGGGRDSLADRALAACIVHVIKAAPTRVDYLRPILGNHVHSEAITISSAAPQIGRRAISFTPRQSPSAHLKAADALIAIPSSAVYRALTIIVHAVAMGSAVNEHAHMCRSVE